MCCYSGRSSETRWTSSTDSPRATSARASKVDSPEFVLEALRAKHVYKPEARIKQILAEMTKSGGLEPREYQQLVSILMNHNQADIDSFQRFAGGFCISYAEFVEKLLRFKLEKYENGLRSFNQVFRLFDKDEDGVLSSGEMRQMLAHLEDCTKGTVALEPSEILRSLDPLETDVFNFSHLVAFFLNFTVERNRRKTSFIQFLKEITR